MLADTGSGPFVRMNGDLSVSIGTVTQKVRQTGETGSGFQLKDPLWHSARHVRASPVPCEPMSLRPDPPE
ncbi:hypothetical protein GCM10023088_21170 [Actinomadura verrucosospora]